MRFSTEDERLAIRMSPAPPYDARFSIFQLILNGLVVGDAEPCIPISALRRMAELPALDDARLDSLDPVQLRTLLTSGDDLHDRTLGPSSESLDAWGLHAYRLEDQVAYLAWRLDEPAVAVLAWVADAEHQALAEAAIREYHRRADAG